MVGEVFLRIVKKEVKVRGGVCSASATGVRPSGSDGGGCLEQAGGCPAELTPTKPVYF